MRRKLYLVNEVGSTFYFDYVHNCLIENLDGLGFEFDIEYENFEADFVETKRSIPQRSITLDLVFLDGYQGFTRWREFVTKSNKLRLFYSCDGVKYCYVNVRSSTKTQMESNSLRTQVVVDCLSLWLVNKSYSFNVRDMGGGKIYTYTYPHEYAVSFNGSITVVNESSRRIPMVIRLIGNLYNPRVIVRQNGVEVSSLRLLIDERDQPTIEVSAVPTNQYINKIEGSEVTDYYDKQDFSYDNFLYLPSGESEVFFDPGVREEATCEIEFKEEYVAH